MRDLHPLILRRLRLITITGFGLGISGLGYLDGGRWETFTWRVEEAAQMGFGKRAGESDSGPTLLQGQFSHTTSLEQGSST